MLKIFEVSSDYIDYLHIFEKNILYNKDDGIQKKRKYIGIVLQINGYNYLVPLSSPKASDYLLIDGRTAIRPSIVPIMRITENSASGKKLIGTLKFSNMIPVPDCSLIPYDLASEPDKKYKTLLTKQLVFIRHNQNHIYRNARTIYKQKKDKKDIAYIKNTVDFTTLEKKCKVYIEMTR